MKRIGLGGLVALAYLFLLLYGYGLENSVESVRIYWPAAGLLLAILVLSKFRYWPLLIGLAFFLDELGRVLQKPDYQIAWSNIDYFFSNEVGSAVAALVLRLWTGSNPRWLSLSGFLRILVAGSVVGATIGATIGTLSLSPTDTGFDTFLHWRLWWLSETLGILTFGTLTLWSVELFHQNCEQMVKLNEDWRRPFSLVAYIVLVGLLFTSSRGLAQPFLLYPPLIWIAVQLGPWYTSTVLTSTIILAVEQTTRGVGPFVHLGSEGSSATAVQLFSFALALSSLSLSTNLIDRNRSVKRKETVLTKLGDSELRYETLLEHAGVPILVVQEQGVRRANPAACRLWERTTDEMMVPLSELSAKEQSNGDDFSRFWPERFLDGTVLPWTAKTSSGKLLELDLHVSKVKLPGGTHIQLVARNKTEQLKLEKMLEKERLRLNEEVSIATLELEETHRQLERANLQRQRFLATISHELRTPLTAILGRSETLLEGLWGPLTAEQKSSIGRIVESGQFLGELVRDLLDLAKVESLDVPMELAQHRLVQICESSVRLVANMAEKKKVSIEPLDVCDRDIEVDSRFFKQILVNLLTNAVKFTPPGGKVGIKVREEQPHIILEVWDTGCGMDEELQARLFQPFVRGDSSVPGFGLGLALVQRLCRAMGGDIEAQSAPKQGTTFRVRLPIKSNQPMQGQKTKRLTLLLKDSGDSNPGSIVQYFQDRGYRVLRSSEFADIRRLLLEHPNSILLSDIEPELPEFLQSLHPERSDDSQHVVVVLTEQCEDKHRDELLQAGVSLIVMKPIPLSDLEALFLELR